MRNGAVFTPGTTFGVDMSLHLGESSAKSTRSRARTPGPEHVRASSLSVLLHGLFRIFLPIALAVTGFLLFRKLYSLQHSTASGLSWMAQHGYSQSCSSGASAEVLQQLMAQKSHYERLHRDQDAHRTKVDTLSRQLDAALNSVNGLQSRITRVAPQDVDIGSWQNQQAQLKSSHADFLHELQTIEQHLQKLASQSVNGGSGGSQGGASAEPSEAAVREINERLAKVSSTIDQLKEKTQKLQSSSASLVTAEDVQRAINQRIAVEMPQLTAKQEQDMQQRVKELVSGQCVDSANIEHLVREAVASSARSASIVVGAGEVVGRPDYAARSNGGIVVAHMTSPSFTPDDAWLSSSLAHYFHVDNGVGSPNDAISEDVSPGSCWAMQGAHGQLTVDLPVPIVVDAVTIDHAPFNTLHDVTTAPKRFEVWGYESRSDRPKLLGTLQFDLSKHNVQTFKLPSAVSNRLSRLTMKVLSNHGNEHYTCVYRFRVHGLP